ncbi:hypothetical protein ACIPPJ_20115 [Streptomyces sp. NPDC086091]|uniref:hypothetical protein n=1 Tax=Streptomyces sp. NPDC086091 TaxID=3365751 RepID=UPI003802F35B
MKRRTLPVAVALAATTTLLLTACGGGGEAGVKDEIAGADRGNSAPSASAPPNTSAGGTGRPDLTLPNDVKETFQGWKTGDKAKDAVLADAGRSMTAVNRAISDGDVNSPGLAYYFEGKALVGSVKWVQTFIDNDATVTGTTRYYAPSVTLSGDTSAAVALCADETKAFNKYRKTGKVDRDAPSDDSYVYFLSRLERNAKGVWVTTEVASKGGSAQCVP